MTVNFEKIKEVFFSLIRYIVKGEELSSDVKNLITEDLLKQLFKISKRQALSHLVCDALEKNSVAVSQELLRKFKNEKNVAIFRSKQIDYELEQIRQVFEKEKIDFIFLKGALIRSYYPEKWMRTSCDVDVLIKEEKLKTARDILTRDLSYKFTGETAHDVQFLSDSEVNLELHFSLLKDGSKSENVLDCVWENLVKTSSSQKVLTSEFFYFYHIAHMATHFKLGGCGIRSFIDLYLISEKLDINQEVLDRFLLDSGLSVFAEAMLLTAKYIMGEKVASDVVFEVIDFVFNAGMYGDIKNRSTINQIKKGGKNKYLTSRIFLPINELSNQYPKLKKHKILYLFYSIKRLFRLAFGSDAKRVRYEIKTANSVSEENKTKVENLLNKLNL